MGTVERCPSCTGSAPAGRLAEDGTGRGPLHVSWLHRRVVLAANPTASPIPWAKLLFALRSLNMQMQNQKVILLSQIAQILSRQSLL